MTKIIKNLRKTPLSVEFFDLCSRNALKGQPAHSPGQRPGLWERGKFALKGQKNGVLVKLLPFQGDSRTSRIPRALPRADISLALQAVLHN